MNTSPTHHDSGPWKDISSEAGIRIVEVANFEVFFQFVNRIGVGGTDDHYLWRGQRRAEWEVTSTLRRSSRPQHEDTHLHRFMRALARCTNMEYDLSSKNPQSEETKLRLWSLGQHWGLFTPLIDLTVYPYYALFFAFAEPDNENAGERAVFALDGGQIPLVNFAISNTQGTEPFQQKLNNPPYDDEFSKYLNETYGGIHPHFGTMVSDGNLSDVVKKRISTDQYQREKKKELKLYYPNSNDNKRIHSQGGLHVYTPNNVSLETWARMHHKISSEAGRWPLLTKILIPNKERESILTSLNKMNVNHLTLFPDFEGAAKHCNLALSEGYLGRTRDY